MKTLLISSCVFAALLLGCGQDPEPEPTPTPNAPRETHVVGTFVLKQEPLPYMGHPAYTPTPAPSCRGRGGYNDIGPGMEVLLTSDGTTLSVGRFSTGRVMATTKVAEECEFTFELDVPEGRTFYTVKVGTRGERTYSFAEITAAGALAFTIGR